jgi:hypothetical protein
MPVQQRGSSRPVNGAVSAAVRKPSVVYISEKDPRNTPDYLKNFPGTIRVLSEKEFSVWLASEFKDVGGIGTATAGDVLNDSVENTLYGQVDNAMLPPGKPKWNTADIHYVTSDGEIFENITITFDPSPTDDGTYEYHVFYEIPAAGVSNQSQNPTAKGTANGYADIAWTYAPTTTSSLIRFKWDQISSAVSYEVGLTGSNIPGSSGSHTFTMPAAGGVSNNNSYCTGSVSNGVYQWTLNKGSSNFSGAYHITVKVIYATSSSTGVSSDFTI